MQLSNLMNDCSMKRKKIRFKFYLKLATRCSSTVDAVVVQGQYTLHRSTCSILRRM